MEDNKDPKAKPMQNIIMTRSFFNIGTQRALYEKDDGYVNKDLNIQEHVRFIKKKYGLDKIYRFDLGQNNDGCDIEVIEKISGLFDKLDKRKYFKNYPEFVACELKEKIASLHGISPENVLLSAGLDQMLIIIASSFLEYNDRVLVNSPSFYLFEEYSRRMGAVIIRLHLHEEKGFRWTSETLYEYKDILKKLKPKLIWLADPNNPSGISIPDVFLEDIIKTAQENYAFVVIDEAYGEYTDVSDGVKSASQYLKDYKNLIVLRTFSKAYGLGNLRIAYAMTCENDILRALKIHRPYFPITQFSFDFALLALDRMDYIEIVRNQAQIRKNLFLDKIKKNGSIRYIDTDSSIIMIRHNDMTADMLISYLEEQGIIVATVPGEKEISKWYVRVTLGKMEELNYFAKVLKSLDNMN
jgi:histidinol-phosphate aminotransferase